MKTFITSIVTLLVVTYCCFPQLPDSNIIWKTGEIPLSAIFNAPDTNYIFLNQEFWNRFSKVDSRTGITIDSIYGKGQIFAISPDGKFLYTNGGNTNSIWKLDINTYQAVDSIDDKQDIPSRVPAVTLTTDGRIFIAPIDSKYIFAILDANNLEIVFKKLKTDISKYLYHIGNIAVSPNNDYFVLDMAYEQLDTASGNWSYWGQILVWDMKTMLPTNHQLFPYTISNKANVYTFSPDGKYFFLSNNILHIFDIKDFELVKILGETYWIDFTSDGKKFALQYEKRDIVYNIVDFSEECIQNSPSTILLKFSWDDVNFYIYSADDWSLKKVRACSDITGLPILNVSNNSLTLSNNSTELTINYYVQNKDEMNYNILDLNGNIIKNGKILISNRTGKIYISDLANGIYFLKIGKETFKFSVVR